MSESVLTGLPDDPEFLYGAPHLDMHFYTTDADREVDPAAPDFAERAVRLPGRGTGSSSSSSR
ncbi:hypothetical protein NWP13_17615 [Rhodococcus pyridinivorans]|nr:hypothetical protein [Rhodococcus pyridinivorans]